MRRALHLATMGSRVVGAGLSEEKVEPLAKAAGDNGMEVRGVVLDVTDPVACEAFVTPIEPWAVVNNARYMNVGRVVDVDPAEALRQLDALVVGPMHLATLAVPAMRRNVSGRIINVSCSIAHVTFAMTGWYQGGRARLLGGDRRLPAGGRSRRHRRDPHRARGASTLGSGTRPRTICCDAASSPRPRRLRPPLVMLRRLGGTMPGAPIAAEAIGEALSAARPRLRHEVGVDAPLVRLAEHLLPERVQDRLRRSALGR